MVDRSKVPDYRVLDVVYNSQPHLGRVVCNYSNGKEIWILKRGRDGNFAYRCDRSVREAISRNWCERDSSGYLRPTAIGLQALKSRDTTTSRTG